MKIFSAAQIREWDTATIHRQNISSAALMERAATACTGWLTAAFPQDTLFLILCGMGNNGGDGLAIARLLDRQGLDLGREDDRTLDFGRTLARANERGGEECGGQGEAGRREDGSAWMFHRGGGRVTGPGGTVVGAFAIHGVDFVGWMITV